MPTGRHTAPTNDSNLFANNPFIQKGFGTQMANSNLFEKEKPKKVTPTATTGIPHYKAGDTVYHSRFGEGTVLNLQPVSNDYEVTVAFQNSGTKKMRASFAKLKIVTK